MKCRTPSKPAFYIAEMKGSLIWTKFINDKREIIRDISQFKLANKILNSKEDYIDDTDKEISKSLTMIIETNHNEIGPTLILETINTDEWYQSNIINRWD